MPLTKEQNRIRMRLVRADNKEHELDILREIESKRGSWTRQCYAEFLKKYYWDDFFTVTFREPRKEPYYAARNVWNQLKEYNVAMAFMGVEPHQSGDLHVHGIMSGNGPGWKPEIKLPWEIWEGLFKKFGRNKVEMCNTLEAVTGYCSKYILKQQKRCVDYYYLFGDAVTWNNNIMVN